MNPQNKIDYDAYQKDMAVSYSFIESAKLEAWKEGWKEGWQQGWKEGWKEGEFTIKKKVIINAYKNGIEIKMISNITRNTQKSIIEILKNEGLM
jgi:flagellar biosynthesis/type III secretory pathway protein FliH